MRLWDNLFFSCITLTQHVEATDSSQCGVYFQICVGLQYDLYDVFTVWTPTTDRSWYKVQKIQILLVKCVSLHSHKRVFALSLCSYCYFWGGIKRFSSSLSGKPSRNVKEIKSTTGQTWAPVAQRRHWSTAPMELWARWENPPSLIWFLPPPAWCVALEWVMSQLYIFWNFSWRQQELLEGGRRIL